jgi:hypothetical protein
MDRGEWPWVEVTGRRGAASSPYKSEMRRHLFTLWNRCQFLGFGSAAHQAFQLARAEAKPRRRELENDFLAFFGVRVEGKSGAISPGVSTAPGAPRPLTLPTRTAAATCSWLIASIVRAPNKRSGIRLERKARIRETGGRRSYRAQPPSWKQLEASLREPQGI